MKTPPRFDSTEKLRRDSAASTDKKLSHFCVIFGEDKRDIAASDCDELERAIRDRFKIDDASRIRSEYWSNVYQEWMLLDQTLPEPNSKIQLRCCGSSSPVSESQSASASEDASRSVIASLNEAFRRFNESKGKTGDDDADAELNNFETAVIFIIKRHEERNHVGANMPEIDMRFQQQQEIANAFAKELRDLKACNKHTKAQLDHIEAKLLLAAAPPTTDDAPQQDSTKQSKKPTKKRRLFGKTRKANCIIS